jgi:hypothetical protein
VCLPRVHLNAVLAEGRRTVQVHTRLRRLVQRLVRREQDEWSIGIYGGRSPFDFEPLTTIKNPVLTRDDVSDVKADFIADAFMLKAGHAWYMFFEVMNCRTVKGEIALATSADVKTWTYQQVVLAEPFSLSYPYVFEWANDYYMVPESRGSGSVRLYKASAFPTRWSFVGPLLGQGASTHRCSAMQASGGCSPSPTPR